jgi:hypothetical protein
MWGDTPIQLEKTDVRFFTLQLKHNPPPTYFSPSLFLYDQRSETFCKNHYGGGGGQVTLLYLPKISHYFCSFFLGNDHFRNIVDKEKELWMIHAVQHFQEWCIQYNLLCLYGQFLGTKTKDWYLQENRNDGQKLHHVSGEKFSFPALRCQSHNSSYRNYNVVHIAVNT